MHVGMAAKQAMSEAPTPLSGPLALEVVFHMPRPKRLPKGLLSVPHLCRPDTDNLVKSTQDALQMASVVSDDSCFYRLTASKFYADYDTPSRAVIRIILAGESLEA